MAVTRIRNNQIFDKTITAAKIADGTLVGTLFSPDLLLNSNITITGNLSVIGNSSTISSTNTYVNDPLVVFNNGYTGAPTYDVGILVNRNLNPLNTAWIWNEGAQAFEGIFTSETGGTVGVINNSGFTTVKVGNLQAVTSATIGNVLVSGDTVTTSDTNGNLHLGANGTGVVVVNTNTIPSAANTLNLGSATDQFNTVYAQTFNTNGAVITTSSGNVTITPPSGGSTVVANLVISGSGSVFSGNVVGNATITGGTINNTTIGATTPSSGVFTSIVDLGALTANGVNAAISLAPTGTGTVTINPATTGSINNMSANVTTLTTNGTTTLAATSVTSLTTSNAFITGGSITNTPIVNSNISGGTGSFTDFTATGNIALSGAYITVAGVEAINNTTQSTIPTNGALIVAGGVGVAKNLNIGGNLTVAQSTTLGSVTYDATGDIHSTGNITITSASSVKIGTLAYPQIDGPANYVVMTNGAGTLSLQPIIQVGTGNAMPLGSPTVGTLTDNNPAITTWTTATYVTDAVDRLNEVLGKLVPPQPPTFPGTYTLAIQSLSSGSRMTNFVQTTNFTGNASIAGGATVSAYRRSNTYTTNATGYVGPGDNGTVSATLNGVTAGSRTIVSGTVNNGTYGNLVISNNVDYGTVTSTALNFWYAFQASASGTVPAGWNEVSITDTLGSASSTAIWYYDASAPGTPVVGVTSFAPSTPVTAYSSSVPHYTNSTVWTAAGTATRLSGDLYPATDTFLTGTAGGSFSAPASVTYTSAGITTPLVQNLYVSSGNASWSTTAATVNATGVSSAGAALSVNNSYATGTGTASPGGSVLTINTSDTSKVNENNIVVGTFGSGGSLSALRVGGLATGSTPPTGTAAAWTSSSALVTSDAAVVAGVLSNNTTNYSTGYFPAGPNLSGQAATQYATFRIQRDAVSKFDIAVIGKLSGCQVAIPGSSIDTTAAPTNGWIDATAAYSGAGVPGTGTGGNGSTGCALGGTMTTGVTLTQSITVTFGTESSHNSTSNYIYVRFILGTGDSITALSFANPTH